jgi:thioredoxin 1
MSYKKYSDLVEDETKDDNSGIPDIVDADQKKNLVRTNKVVVVDIYGDWCQPCKQIAPRFKLLSEEYKQYGFVFAKENVEKNISQNIRGVPNFQYFYNGRMIGDTTGGDMQAVKAKLEEMKAMVSKGI